MTVNVAIIGVSTLTGENLLEILDAREFQIDSLKLFDQPDEAGRALMYKGRSVRVKALEAANVEAGLDIVFLCDSELNEEQLELVAGSGALIIDLFPARQQNAPVFVPEVNGAALADVKQGDIIASPGSAAIAAALSLAPLQSEYQLLKLNAFAMHSAAELGRPGIEALASETARLLNARDADPSLFPVQYAFNVLTPGEEVDSDGISQTERRFVAELKELLADEELEVVMQVALVPAFYGVSLMLQAETARPVDLEQAERLLSAADSVILNRGQKPVTPVGSAVGNDQVYVSRLRLEADSDSCVGLCAVTDNLRKGSALNAVHIAEHWHRLHS
ncbi:Asd/ArgC dimerization domain-containing protein [Marinobacterium mangrovicola]|uniref:Aspartate-semialdehyde dehydrogenase n=1 Tax=Marinobacterium mangrovicola TaxID=1476959 RepID=A0A4R1GQ01_9GAMM|nr:Asd/ArgC dimerization domain-containing protein [Marinobacterium mangrovicola]TCK09440.1 aspartate-semialdehyde dehydrogenase [Marinobacterium mangrovicola]